MPRATQKASHINKVGTGEENDNCDGLKIANTLASHLLLLYPGQNIFNNPWYWTRTSKNLAMSQQSWSSMLLLHLLHPSDRNSTTSLTTKVTHHWVQQDVSTKSKERLGKGLHKNKADILQTRCFVHEKSPSKMHRNEQNRAQTVIYSAESIEKKNHRTEVNSVKIFEPMS